MSQLRGHSGGEGLLSDVYAALRIMSLGPVWAPELDSEPTLHPARRTRLYGAAYESPRLIPSAKGKVLQVGGKLCRQVLLGALPPRQPLPRVWRPRPHPHVSSRGAELAQR